MFGGHGLLRAIGECKMTKRKTTPTTPERTALSIPLEEARAKVYRQLDEGNKLLQRQVRSQDEFEAWKADQHQWQDYTSTLLRNISNTNELADDFYGFGGYTLGRDKSLQEEIQDEFDEVKRLLPRLASVYKKLELYPVVVSGGSGTPAQSVLRDVANNASPQVNIFNYGTISNPQIQQGTNQTMQHTHMGAEQTQLLELVQQMQREIRKISPQVPPLLAEQMKRDIAALAGEAESDAPRKAWLEVAIGSLKTAAQDAKEIGLPLLDMATRAMPLIAVLIQMHNQTPH